MPARCVAPNCGLSHPDVSVFRFPNVNERHPGLFERWVQAVQSAYETAGMAEQCPTLASSRSRICELHFKPTDYKYAAHAFSPLKRIPNQRKSLVSDAVPSIFNVGPVPFGGQYRWNMKSEVGAGQSSADLPGRVTITRPPREPQQQPDWSVVDVSLDEEYGGWEMEDEEDSSIQMQGDQSISMQGGGEQWVEQLPQSHQGMVTTSQPYAHEQVVQVLPRERGRDQVMQVMPSVGHVPMHRQSAASSHGLAQDISPHNAKRRRTEPMYHAAPSTDDYRQHQQIQNQSVAEDPVVVVVSSGQSQPQMQQQLTTTAGRVGGKSVQKRVESGEIHMVRDKSPDMIEEWGTGSGVKRQTVRSNGVQRGKASREATRGGSPANSYQQRPGRVSTPLLSNADPMAPVSFEEEDDVYGYCFTCQDPLMYEDQEKRSLLATQGNMKVLHALRQMCWPGLFSPDPRYFSTLTCCGSCVELIKEYVQTLKTLSTLKGTWLERTGHNSAPHFNPLHQDISFARDSAGFNAPSMQRPSWHSPGASPRRDNLQSASDEQYQQGSDSPVREQRQAAGRSGQVGQRQVRDIAGPSQPTLMRGDRKLSQRHQDIYQDEDPGTSDDLVDNSRMQQESFPKMDSAVRSQNRGQSSTPEAKRDRAGARASPTPQTLTGKSRRKGTPTRQTTPPPSVASPSQTSQAETAANQQAKVTGKGDAGKRSLPERVLKEPNESPGDLDPGDPEAEVGEGSGDSLPPSVPSTSHSQADEQGQDATPQADHNFESRQEDADLPMTIKEEPVESYVDQPGGSGLPMETADDTWGLDEGR